MPTQNQILKCLYEHYAVVFSPIDAKEAPQASVTLIKAGVPAIPTDYITFLTATNGLSWNGITLFSLNSIEREKGAFFHPGIMQNYAFCQNNAVMKRKILLGWGLETLIVYDAANKEYQILDRYTYESVASYPTFVDFLYALAKPLFEKTDTSK